ncbi:MAG TPA: hypothetical protein VKU80_06450 [Planctomycetota bacterium]|nr:hypothetical protein [Planctomycetota bacterium]
MGTFHGGRSGRAASQVQELLEDLDALCDGPGLTLHLGRDAGRVTVGRAKQALLLRSGGRVWKRITRRERRETLLGWIRDAAGVTRSRLPIGKRGA